VEMRQYNEKEKLISFDGYSNANKKWLRRA
jgi:hypothetical protein